MTETKENFSSADQAIPSVKNPKRPIDYIRKGCGCLTGLFALHVLITLAFLAFGPLPHDKSEKPIANPALTPSKAKRATHIPQPSHTLPSAPDPRGVDKPVSKMTPEEKQALVARVEARQKANAAKLAEEERAEKSKVRAAAQQAIAAKKLSQSGTVYAWGNAPIYAFPDSMAQVTGRNPGVSNPIRYKSFKDGWIELADQQGHTTGYMPDADIFNEAVIGPPPDAQKMIQAIKYQSKEPASFTLLNIFSNKSGSLLRADRLSFAAFADGAPCWYYRVNYACNDDNLVYRCYTAHIYVRLGVNLSSRIEQRDDLSAL